MVDKYVLGFGGQKRRKRVYSAYVLLRLRMYLSFWSNFHNFLQYTQSNICIKSYANEEKKNEKEINLDKKFHNTRNFLIHLRLTLHFNCFLFLCHVPCTLSYVFIHVHVYVCGVFYIISISLKDTYIPGKAMNGVGVSGEYIKYINIGNKKKSPIKAMHIK